MGIKYTIFLFFGLSLFIHYGALYSQNQNAYYSIDSSKYLVHKVSYLDNFFSLKRKYDISRNELIKLNPHLSSGLSVGDNILIPVLKHDLHSIYEPLGFNKKYNIDLLLPFCVSKNNFIYDFDSITKIDFDSIPNFYKKSNISIDFLFGFLMSLDSTYLDTSMVNIRIHDVGEFNYFSEKNLIIDSLINNNVLVNSDLVIGPFYTSNFNYFSENFGDDKVPIVSPFSVKKSIIEDKLNVIQPSVSIFDKIDYLSNFLELNHLSDHNLVIFQDTIFDTIPSVNNQIMIDTILSSDMKHSSHFFQYLDTSIFKHIESIKVQSQVLDSIHHKLDTLGEKNVIIILSQDNIFVTDIISKIHASSDSNICVYTLPSIINYDHISTYKLVDLGVSFPHSSDFVNESILRGFMVNFYNKFKYIPDFKYASSGYKIGLFFLNYLHDKKCILPIRQYSVHKILNSYYLFQKNSNNGYKNSAISIIRYTDFYSGK